MFDLISGIKANFHEIWVEIYKREKYPFISFDYTVQWKIKLGYKSGNWKFWDVLAKNGYSYKSQIVLMTICSDQDKWIYDLCGTETDRHRWRRREKKFCWLGGARCAPNMAYGFVAWQRMCLLRDDECAAMNFYL